MTRGGGRHLWTAPYMSLEHSALAWGLAKQRKRENFLHRQDQLHLIHGKPVGSILFSHCLPKPSIPHYSTVASQCLHFTWLQQQQHWKPKKMNKHCFPGFHPPSQNILHHINIQNILHNIKKFTLFYTISKARIECVVSVQNIRKVNWKIFCTILMIFQEEYGRV